MSQVTRTNSLDTLSAEKRDVAVPHRAIRPVSRAYLRQQILTALPLIAGDVLAAIVSAWVAVVVGGPILGWSTLFTCSFLSLGVVCGLRLLGMYPAVGIHPAFEMKRILTVVGLICACLFVAAISAEYSHHQSWWSVIVLGLCWSALGPTIRSLTRSVFQRFDWWTQPIVFLGAGPAYERLRGEFAKHPSAGLRPLGFFHDTREQWHGEAEDDLGLLGDLNEANEYARDNQIYWAIILDDVTEDEEFGPHLYDEIPHRLFLRSAVDAVPSIWDELVYVERTPFIHQTDKLLLPHNRWLKRCMDLIVAGALAIATAPLVILVALCIKLTSRGPVVYRSVRIGVNGQRFSMTKFRTMRADADEFLRRFLEQHPERLDEWKREHKLKNDPRITGIGQFLRRTSLDELPQIYDVLLGKMSLVGPRPMLLTETAAYGSHFQAFCRMLPGMTGLWQVSGRNRIPHDQRTQLVSYYVQNWSPWLDLYLLAKTAKVVITGDGAY
jgi:Undecaprenyl-phosphate galactose phosphotransferase WbaP